MKSLVNYINESLLEKQLEDVNFVIGRFQPFTLGHERCADYVFEMTGKKTVLCVIDTKKADDKHPFLTDDIKSMLDTVCTQSKNIIGWVRVKNADIVKNADVLRSEGYNPVSWSCGTDRFEQYNKMAKGYGEQAGLSKDFKVYEIKRGDEDISATKVREALKTGDIKAFEECMPKYIHKYFKELKEMIEKV